MRNTLLLFSIVLLSSCGFVTGQLQDKANEEKLLKPGALDLPLTGFYTHYQYKLLDKYEIKHQWLRESNCDYSKVETQKYESKDRLSKDRFFRVYDIYEDGSSTKQRDAHPARNFDRFVRAEYIRKKPNGDIVTEKGFTPICYESWWNTSHSITLFLRKQPLEEMKAGFSLWYPEGTWTTKIMNKLTWHIQETSEDKLRQRPLNGVAGPFQLWVIPLADTGYTMALKLGASKESLQYPDAHLRMQAMFKHLIGSVKIEPIQATTSSTSQPLTESTQPAPANYTALEANQPLPKATATIVREYPGKTEQLQRSVQKDSNRSMNQMLKNTAPKMKH